MAKKKKTLKKRPVPHSRKKPRTQSVKKQLLQRLTAKFPNIKMAMSTTRCSVKMSEVLGEFVKPYKQYAETIDDFRVLIAMGSAAWNVALIPEHKREKIFQGAMDNLPFANRGDAKEILSELIARKEKYFPQYCRMILDYDVTAEGSTWNITVVSSPMEEPDHERMQNQEESVIPVGLIKRPRKIM